MNAPVTLPDAGPVSVSRVQAWVFRAPIDTPVRTSFGVMTDRPAVLVRVEDPDGAFGWGEIWCNFPTCGAEHRARLVDSVLAPRLVGRSFTSPDQAYARLAGETHTLVLQTREYGPVAQALAGVDLALWDLAARRRRVPLWQLLGADRQRVPVYASGINPELAGERVAECRAAGYRAFKIKVGFNAAADLSVARAAADDLGDGEQLMLDANQAWDRDTALDMVRHLPHERLEWLEEPMPVDSPAADWTTLARASPVALAGGENLADAPGFDQSIELGALSVLQPDLCKWGGITGCYTVARRARGAGRRYCPHYLGGGIGLIASAHLLAAAGGDGLLEVDSNPNPLRRTLAQPYPAVSDGGMTLSGDPGLGVEPDLETAARWQVLHTDRHR
ncbi:mandelate racemase/muconate lactonizing enzyme family protein [Arhodomonas aquaeolei]|uniref:mandelate racemase/muconate lactonizing enzyme family protein n=1 Tax=Arhodomonas aquaeolei TaxID=2369 RepID=UPI002168AC09|nr:mandelate racemase/muconate lactonizing enzyme family protein [Arhodomonas aquaeolei]MCS4505364.1 mandelate racemase/muconate lactonizing enzyme family protein [Arhodomonas aquaeolei]